MEGMLSPYRVLDLTDEKGLLCGKLLGDLGADVIKIERPCGDPARNIGPFYHDEIDPEKSLLWFAHNTSKRGITLDIGTADGQETFQKLVVGADFVIESFAPGYLDKLGLGYSALEKINPDIIMVSVTPFGQTGPYKDYQAPDIVAWAIGGVMHPWGDPDRPPYRISHHAQSYLHAGAEAAVGALMALHYRERGGKGQHIDVSIQESVAQANGPITAYWDMMRIVRHRGEQLNPDIQRRVIWPCKDGYVVWIYWGGLSVPWDLPLIAWMDEEGMASDFLKNFDFNTLDYATVTQETIDRIEEPTAQFFLSRTKAELMEGAVKHRTMLYPVSTAADALDSDQLTARGFWVNVEHPELGTTITYPGAFCHASEAPPRISRRAPLIGEHNQEVLEQELSLSRVKTREKGQNESAPKKPLEGIKVIDFGWNITIPLTAKILSDCGAEVVEVESVIRLDPLRTMGPFKDGVAGLNRCGNFNQWNTGKLGMTLNLAYPKGLEIARRLVARADIVLENFAGGVMKRMGLGYEELKKIKPDIIMLSSSMYGQTGPLATHPGTGHQLSALTGFNHIAGWPDREPPYLGPYTDYPAPRFNALAILAALDYRRRTGRGQYLDMAQLETGIEFLAPVILDYTVNGRVANRMGNRSDQAAPQGAYRCLGEDRWCAISVTSDEEWQSFCRVISNPDLTNNPRFATLQARQENEAELNIIIEEWTATHLAEEVMTMLQAAGVAAGVLQTGEDLLEHDPQLKFRNFFWELEHPEVGTYRSARPSFLLSESPCELKRAPLMSEHNEYVLKELLGMSDEEVAELVIEGILE